MGRSGEGTNLLLVLAVEPQLMLRPVIVVTTPTELSCLNNVKLLEWKLLTFVIRPLCSEVTFIVGKAEEAGL